MKFSAITLLSTTFIASASAYPTMWNKRDVDPSVVPEFGWIAGVNPTGTGDCDGAPGTNVKIPCSCPPDRTLFLRDLNENIAAGRIVNNTGLTGGFTFPTDNSLRSEIDRITGVLIVLQNLFGPGKGCPAASTTLVATRNDLQKALDAGQTAAIDIPSATLPVVSSSFSATPTTAPIPDASSTSAASVITVTVTSTVKEACDATTTSTAAEESAATTTEAAAAATSSAPAVSSDIAAQIAALAPDLGFEAGLNPTGTGDCEGALGPTGPKIPCSCPPDRETFLAQLTANVVAGVAVNNPTVKVDFPLTGDDKAVKLARITASAITIQNLKGPGVGCPVVSTTLTAQANAIQAGN